MSWWQTLLITVVGGGLLTLLGFILARNENASKLASNAVTAMSTNLDLQMSSVRLIEKMRTAMYLQSQRLDAWEDWGLDTSQVFRIWKKYLMEKENLPNLPDMPKPPDGHLDLSTIFTDADIASIRDSMKSVEDLQHKVEEEKKPHLPKMFSMVV